VIAKSPSPTGEDAALKNGTSLGSALRHNNLPVTASNAATMPLMPSVTIVP
jgi:hypothetical protein